MLINLNIDKQLVNKFKNDGFIILNKFIYLDYIDKLKSKFTELFSGKFETGVEPDEWNWKFNQDPIDLTRQICNGWKSNNLVKSFVCHELVGKACAQLMNWKGSKLIQDNVLWKPPGGKTLGYHQDAAYDDWIVPQTMMTCWMSLDDTKKETGTLEYVKGSHEWGLQPPKGEFHSPEDYKEQLKIFAKKNNKELNIVYVEVPAGGVAFHHGNMWHGSGINTSNNHRRAIVSHCVPSDAKFHPTNNGGTAKIYKKYKKEDSDQLPDEFFPLLWKRD